MKWEKETAKAAIERNGGVVAGKQVKHPFPGLKLWGAIDYLVNQHGFTFFKEV